MTEANASSCLCVKEGAVEAAVVDEKGCVCGCFTTTVNRYPNVFRGSSFTREEIAAVKAAGAKR